MHSGVTSSMSASGFIEHTCRCWRSVRSHGRRRRTAAWPADCRWRAGPDHRAARCSVPGTGRPATEQTRHIDPRVPRYSARQTRACQPGQKLAAPELGSPRNAEHGADAGDLLVEGHHLSARVWTSFEMVLSPGTAMCWRSAASTAVSARELAFRTLGSASHLVSRTVPARRIEGRSLVARQELERAGVGDVQGPVPGPGTFSEWEDQPVEERRAL